MRVGIFGGTFNPPHNGHLSAASAFVKAAALDRLYVIPTFLPPHKAICGVSSSDRLSMTKAAFADVPCVTVSDIEILRGGVSYTADTLRSLKDTDDELFLLCGTDMFLTLDTWYQPETIFDLSTVCYVRRETESDTLLLLEQKEKEYKDRFHARIFKIENPDTIEISSSEIREKVKKSKEISRFVPPAVLDYIVEKRLYS